MPGHRHYRPCRASPPFLGHFFRSTGGDGLHSSESMTIEIRSVFLVLLPRSRLVEFCFRSVGLFPPGWNGSFDSWRFRVSLLVVFSTGRFSPIQEPWVPGFLVFLALAISSHCLRHVQGVQLPLLLLLISDFGNFAFVGVDGVFGSGF